jgi:hypothetical protein
VATDAFVSTAVANAIAGVNPAVAVQAATTQASDTSGLTYVNGASGVGATFTGSVNTPITVDGTYTFTATGQRLLVKNDTQSGNPGAYNGIYSLTQLQTSLLPPIFTRATDYNSPADINDTGAIPVQSGTANGTTSWLLISQVVTVGTSVLTYTKFSANPSTLGPGLVNGVYNAVADGGMVADCLIATDGAMTVTSGVVSSSTALANAKVGSVVQLYKYAITLDGVMSHTSTTLTCTVPTWAAAGMVCLVSAGAASGFLLSTTIVSVGSTGAGGTVVLAAACGNASGVSAVHVEFHAFYQDTVASIQSGTQVTITTPANVPYSCTGMTVACGTDNSALHAAAVAAAFTASKQLWVPPGNYLHLLTSAGLSAELTNPNLSTATQSLTFSVKAARGTAMFTVVAPSLEFGFQAWGYQAGDGVNLELEGLYFRWMGQQYQTHQSSEALFGIAQVIGSSTSDSLTHWLRAIAVDSDPVYSPTVGLWVGAGTGTAQKFSILKDCNIYAYFDCRAAFNNVGGDTRLYDENCTFFATGSVPTLVDQTSPGWHASYIAPDASALSTGSRFDVSDNNGGAYWWHENGTAQGPGPYYRVLIAPTFGANGIPCAGVIVRDSTECLKMVQPNFPNGGAITVEARSCDIDTPIWSPSYTPSTGSTAPRIGISPGIGGTSVGPVGTYRINNPIVNIPGTISVATNSTTTITATIADTNRLVVGQTITVTGAAGGTWSNINGTWTIASIVSSTQITFVVSSAPTGSYTAASGYVGPINIVLISASNATVGPVDIVIENPTLTLSGNWAELFSFPSTPSFAVNLTVRGGHLTQGGGINYLVCAVPHANCNVALTGVRFTSSLGGAAIVNANAAAGTYTAGQVVVDNCDLSGWAGAVPFQDTTATGTDDPFSINLASCRWVSSKAPFTTSGRTGLIVRGGYGPFDGFSGQSTHTTSATIPTNDVHKAHIWTLSTSAQTATLPSAVTEGAGNGYTVVNANASTNSLGLAATAGTIPVTTIAAGVSQRVISDGANWQAG